MNIITRLRKWIRKNIFRSYDKHEITSTLLDDNFEPITVYSNSQ